MRLAPIVALLALSACGRAVAASRDFPVAPFDRIDNMTPFDVHVRVGGPAAVRAEGPQPWIDRLEVKVEGGRLVIGSRGGHWPWSSNTRSVVDVSVPTLVGVDLSGPGDLIVDRVRGERFAVHLDGPGDLDVGRMDTRHLEVVLNGPGDVRLAGRADTATFSLHGPGDIRAAALTVRDATVTLNGPGDATLQASGTVQGSLSGPGDLVVRGGARCAVTKQGPGDVDCR